MSKKNSIVASFFYDAIQNAETLYRYRSLLYCGIRICNLDKISFFFRTKKTPKLEFLNRLWGLGTGEE